MRINADGTVVLSRRNLLALLHKLDKPGSARTIYKIEHGFHLRVRAEDNAEHYGADRPGRMSEDTERFIEDQS